MAFLYRRQFDNLGGRPRTFRTSRFSGDVKLVNSVRASLSHSKDTGRHGVVQQRSFYEATIRGSVSCCLWRQSLVACLDINQSCILLVIQRVLSHSNGYNGVFNDNDLASLCASLGLRDFSCGIYVSVGHDESTTVINSGPLYFICLDIQICMQSAFGISPFPLVLELSGSSGKGYSSYANLSQLKASKLVKLWKLWKLT